MMRAILISRFRQSLVLAQASLKARYRNAFAGYVWVIISPMVMFATQAYVFKYVFKVEMQNYVVFLLFGLCPWMFFSQTIEMNTGLLYAQAKLLKSSQISPITLLTAQAFDNLLNSMVMMAAALFAISLLGLVEWQKMVLFPIPYITMLIATVFLSFIISICQVFFFDTRFVVNFVLGLLYFISPIVYPENFVPSQFQFILRLNPLTYLLRPFRTLLESGLSEKFLEDQGIAALIAFLVAIAAVAFWRRSRDAFYFRL